MFFFAKILDLECTPGCLLGHMEATNEKSWLTPAEMAKRTNTTIDTLRYYEKESLITAVARNSAGHRRYSAADIMWVDVLRCLRLTGMPIQQMKEFAVLGQAGEHTEPERYRLLLAHRQEVLQQIADLQSALEVIDHKAAAYKTSINQKDENED